MRLKNFIWMEFFYLVVFFLWGSLLKCYFDDVLISYFKGKFSCENFKGRGSLKRSN
jgi:hypothetical protein